MVLRLTKWTELGKNEVSITFLNFQHDGANPKKWHFCQWQLLQEQLISFSKILVIAAYSYGS